MQKCLTCGEPIVQEIFDLWGSHPLCLEDTKPVEAKPNPRTITIPQVRR